MSTDPIAAWRAHPGFRELFIQATADFIQAVADHEAAALRTVSVGPEGQHERCSPPSARPSGSFSSAAPPKPKRRAGRTPRTGNHALPIVLAVRYKLVRAREERLEELAAEHGVVVAGGRRGRQDREEVWRADVRRRMEEYHAGRKVTM